MCINKYLIHIEAVLLIIVSQMVHHKFQAYYNKSTLYIASREVGDDFS